MAKKISKKDIQKITKLFEDGKDLQAEDFFIAKYILKPAQKLQGFIKSSIARATSRILTQKEMNSLTIRMSNTIGAYDTSLRGLYTQYSNMFSKYVFNKTGVTSPFVKGTIKKNSIELFKTNIKGALSRTNSEFLNNVRKFQTDLIKAQQKIDRAVDVGQILKKDAHIQFEKQLRSITKLNKKLGNMKQGKFITYRDGSMHSLTSYNEMAVRTTVLNVDRTAVEVKSGVSGRRVVEYYLRDKRSVKEKRAVCNSIMHTKIKGIPMIALDQGAADILGIRTLEQAKQEDGKAFGPNCRHSIKPLPAAVYNEIEKVLFLSETEVA